MQNQDLKSDVKRLLSIAEAAAALGVCVKTIRLLIQSRKISFIRVGNRYRFEIDDLNKYKEKNKTKAVA
ncbi:MAG: helix-turn-helix domain-containing protein [bacterium]